MFLSKWWPCCNLFSFLELWLLISQAAIVVLMDAALEGNDLIGKVGAVMIDRVLGQPAVRQFFGSEIVGAALGKLQTASTKITLSGCTTCSGRYQMLAGLMLRRRVLCLWLMLGLGLPE